MQKTTLYLPDELRQRLRSAAKQTGRSQADLTRDALEEYLARQPRRTPRSLGMLADGTMSGAEAKRWAREQFVTDYEERRREDGW